MLKIDLRLPCPGIQPLQAPSGDTLEPLRVSASKIPTSVCRGTVRLHRMGAPSPPPLAQRRLAAIARPALGMGGATDRPDSL